MKLAELMARTSQKRIRQWPCAMWKHIIFWSIFSFDFRVKHEKLLPKIPKLSWKLGFNCRSSLWVWHFQHHLKRWWRFWFLILTIVSLCCVCPGAKTTPKRLPQKYLGPVHLSSQRISRTKPKPRISLKTANLALGLGGLRAYAALVLYEPKGGIWVSEKNEYPSCVMNSPLHAQKSIYFSSPPLHFSPSNQDLLSGHAAVAIV